MGDTKNRTSDRKRNGNRSEQWRAALFLSPTWVLLLLFFFIPGALTFYLAFTNMALTGAAAANTEFVGFQNFTYMFQDETFRISVWNTIIFLIFSAVVGQQVLGFIIAFLMNGRNRTFRSIIGSIVISGWVAPEVVTAFVWFAFLNDTGTVNAIIESIGFEPITWLYTFPMVSIIIANIWRGTAFSMMVFQTALSDVPKEVEEAAMIDGASPWQRLVRITIPMIMSSVVTNMVLITLQTLGSFTLIFALTGGGPGNSTETLPLYMYHQAFVNYQLGYGTAISLILLMIGIIASLVYMKVLKVKL
ncbi:carbohydrate ABC transporter permease [Paenibacillus sinopodophylli]|uniref:carbohydrate ABC transporter permease n=1 Tax=Paenibacillus sinopodophylli TaxID=1837342 RepID=UPI00110CE815|nr:sugar ABC transporter permease [Paenibacillus sinopodophylli]